MAIPNGNRGGRPQKKSNAPRNNGRGPRPAGAPAAQPKPKVTEDEDGEGTIEMDGVVVGVYVGTQFRVRVANGHEFLAHISGKMRKRFIRLVVGDRVRIEVSPYDLEKARIVFRLN
ncbi:MAG: translation initiation factor IF-1 [Akkermansia sp.]